MSRPGDRFHRLATNLCTERTRRRLIDPAIADLQSEFAVARRAGSTWHTGRALMAGYLSITKVLAIAACGDLWVEASTWQPAERSSARRGLVVALLTTAVATGLLIATFDSAIQTNWRVLGYLVPSMLTAALPLGLLIGSAWTLHGAGRTRKLAAGCVVAAALCSIAMYVNVSWLTPESNQTFRERAFEQNFGPRDTPLERGLYELTMPDLRSRIERELSMGHPERAHVAEVVFYLRFVVAVAILPMVGVILALAFRREWTRGWLTAAAVVTFSAYYAMVSGSRAISETLSIAPIVTAWAGPVLLTGTALLLTWRRPRARA
jgi:lipopolysaccharide export LptBFGC system permease protein LptF